MSRRQLHEHERGADGTLLAVSSVLIRDCAVARPSVRLCEMEVLDQLQPRAKAKFRKAIRARVSAPPSVTPHIQSWLYGTGNGCGRKRCGITQGDLSVSAEAVGGEEETTTLRCAERSRITSYELRSRVMPVEQRG